MFWLDAIDPLKSTYLVYPHDFRHRHHTMSSVNKQVMVYQKQHSYLDRQARMDAKKLPQKSNSESGRASSIASSSKQLPNVKVVDTRRKLLKASQSLQKSLSSNADGLVTKV